MARLLATATFLVGLTLGCTGRAAVGLTQSQEVEAAIHEASAVFPVPAPMLRCLFSKESGFRPWANENPPYMGLAQFDASTFRYAVRVLRNPAAPEWPLLGADATPWRARDAALATAGLIARGEGGRWPPLRWC
jgi:hypothetical protein